MISDTDKKFVQRIKEWREESNSVDIFTKREIQLILNATHERAMRLLDVHNSLLDKHAYDVPDKKDIDLLYNGYEEHIKLVKKLQVIYDNSREG